MGKTVLTLLRSILRNTFRLAMSRGIIDRDPSIGLVIPFAEEEARRELTDEETAAALHVGREHPEGLLLLLLYFLGVRKGEATGLQWRDLDFKNKMVYIERDVDYKTGKVGKVKTKAALCSIPLPDELCDVLYPIRGIGSTFILQAPKTHSFLSESTYKRRWTRLMQAL